MFELDLERREIEFRKEKPNPTGLKPSPANPTAQAHFPLSLPARPTLRPSPAPHGPAPRSPLPRGLPPPRSAERPRRPAWPPPLSARAPSLTAWSHTPATPPAPRHALSLPRLAHPSAAPSPPFLPPRRETEPRHHRRGRRDPYPAAPRRDPRIPPITGPCDLLFPILAPQLHARTTSAAASLRQDRRRR